MWKNIAAHISQVTGEKFEIDSHRSVAGGCINQGYRVTGGDCAARTLRDRTYFIKLNSASEIAMFAAEAEGLKQMHQTKTIRVPQPLCVGTEGNYAYIVMEWLELGSGNSQAWEEMGRQLAAMHRCTPPKVPENCGFGWDQNNTIGSTPQINTWTADWAEFFAKHRLGYQFKLARSRGGHFPQQDKLLAAIPELLASHQPQACLVHGDLWGGNAACTVTGEPVIIDPATYVGDREVDIAMTELFGGLTAAFYRGYNEAFPLDTGYKKRKTLYNLYHILNHFNLYGPRTARKIGGGYGSQANRMISEILA
ncbi:MAG: fructosamine kinase family protein [Hormoscilla sp. SP5CHS1]|nr:fructosamine kinase family protein [Hormoscilla sp. SP12CHS1]MBC6454599.1 fructosamine kinase family protein [Hormoscilla sp. SP5CHS1]